MSSIADARAAIYSRLASSPTFHPASANLFENWTLQGGDVVTVKSDNDSYNLPIYGMKVKWNGSTKVTVQSTGNEQREPLEKMAAKENERNNYRNRVWTSKNLQEIHYDIFDEEGHFHSTLDMTASYLRTSFEDADNALRSSIEVTASVLRTEFQDADNSLRSSITETSSNVEILVEGTGSNIHIKPAVIQASIDAASESSRIVLSADHIDLDGYVTANYISSKIATIDDLTVGGVIRCTNVYLTTGGIASTTSMNSSIYDIKIELNSSTNTYTLSKQLCDPDDGAWKVVGTFSRAISSASWSWVGGAPRVTLSPQNQSFTGKAINGITFNSSTKAWATDKKSFSQDFYCYDTNSNTVYIENLSINTLDSYNQGYTDGQASVSHSIDIPTTQIYTSDRYTGTKLNTLKTKYEQAKSDGDYVMFRVDCGGTSKWYYMEP